MRKYIKITPSGEITLSEYSTFGEIERDNKCLTGWGMGCYQTPFAPLYCIYEDSGTIEKKPLNLKASYFFNLPLVGDIYVGIGEEEEGTFDRDVVGFYQPAYIMIKGLIESTYESNKHITVNYPSTEFTLTGFDSIEELFDM